MLWIQIKLLTYKGSLVFFCPKTHFPCHSPPCCYSTARNASALKCWKGCDHCKKCWPYLLTSLSSQFALCMLATFSIRWSVMLTYHFSPSRILCLVRIKHKKERKKRCLQVLKLAFIFVSTKSVAIFRSMSRRSEVSSLDCKNKLVRTQNSV